jgi:hypothetical protein
MHAMTNLNAVLLLDLAALVLQRGKTLVGQIQLELQADKHDQV